MPIFERLTSGWVDDDVGLFFSLEKVAERGDIMQLGAGLPTVVGRRTRTRPQVIARLKTGSSWSGSMMAGIIAGDGPLVHGASWTGVVDTGWAGGFLGIFNVGTMVTLGGNAFGVNSGTLGEGAGQSGWKTTAGAGRGAIVSGAVGVLAVTLEKCGRVFGWQRIDSRPALQTGLEWDVRGHR